MRGSGGNAPPVAVPASAQEEVFLRVENLAQDVAKPRDVGDVLKPEAALLALLKGRGECQAPAEPVTLAPFCLERVSLPESLSGVPPAGANLPEHARRFLDRPELMLKEDPPIESFTPYWDPCLLHSKRHYIAFIRKLMSIDFLLFTTTPKEHIGVFFVHKSDGQRIRLIVDARAANRHFRQPPGVELCSAEGFARIEVGLPKECQDRPAVVKHVLERGGLRFGLSDVKDAFHRLRQPFWLAECFCVRPLEARHLGLAGAKLQGRLLLPHDKGSLCMGFTWSLYFCQVLNETLADSVPRLLHSEIIRDRGAATAFSLEGARCPNNSEEVRRYVYVDNLGIVSPHEAIVRDSLQGMDKEFSSRGLLLHPGEVGSEVKALGVELDGMSLCARITSKRFHKVRQAIRGALKRRRISGRILEVIVGHATYCSLMCRPLLSVFNAVYKFIQSCYFAPVPLWESVRQELSVFAGAMLFLRSDWWRSWSPRVTMSDSSKGGFGVCCSTWPENVVAEVGRLGERSRFKRTGPHSARESALTSAGFMWDSEAQCWTVNDSSPDLEADWDISEGFKEIPAQLLRRELWKPVRWGRWEIDEDISVLEARALLKGLKRALCLPDSRSKRHLFLIDNMGVTLAFSRSRSSHFRILRQIRQASAYLLATNSSASFRWLPSELNSSDEPSRLYDSAPSKLLADQIPRPSHATGQTEDPASRRKFGSQSSKARAKETAGASEDTSNQQEKPDFDFGNECTEKQQAVNQQGFRPQSSSPRAALATEPKEANRDADRQQLKRQPVSVPRERVLAPRRRARRSSTMVTNFFQDNSSLLPATRLERQAVSSSTQASYQAELERFMKYAQRHQLDTNLGEAMDNSLVQHMNALYRQGFQSYHGDRLMASVMHRHPSCGRLGNVKMPRAWRALKGWRKLCPGRTRMLIRWLFGAGWWLFCSTGASLRWQFS